jgi:Tol biopolymer transport system component
MLKLTAFLFLFIPVISFSQTKLDSLTVEKIMRDPKWIGTSPSNPFWNADGTKLFFNWNPENAPSDTLYYISLENKIPVKAPVAAKEQGVNANDIVYNQNRTAFVYEKDDDIFYKEIKSNKTIRITQTEETESTPQFSFHEKEIAYRDGQNLFSSYQRKANGLSLSGPSYFISGILLKNCLFPVITAITIFIFMKDSL